MRRIKNIKNAILGNLKEEMIAPETNFYINPENRVGKPSEDTFAGTELGVLKILVISLLVMMLVFLLAA